MKRILLFVVPLIVLAAGVAGVYYYSSARSTGDAPQADADSTDAGDVQQASVEKDAQEGDADDEGEDGDPAVPVNVVPVAVGAVSTYISTTANLVPEDEVRVLAEAEGRVTRLLVEEGDSVEAGQLLAALLRDEAEILYKKATLKASNAEMAYERAARMAGENLMSREEFDKVTMDHRIAQQGLAEARWMLDKTEIRSPFDGRLTLRSVTLGQHVRPGDELFVVTDFDPLISRIYLPEKDVLELREERDVRITLKADDSVEFDGRIRQISPVVDTATGTVKVTIEAIRPPAKVRPGGFVTIDIVRETREDTMLLPRKAVIRELKQAHVFVVRDEVAEKRSVELGLEEDEHLEILSGLEPGEQVVVAGQGSLKDGSKIKILEPKSEIETARLNETAERRAQG